MFGNVWKFGTKQPKKQRGHRFVESGIPSAQKQNKPILDWRRATICLNNALFRVGTLHRSMFKVITSFQKRRQVPRTFPTLGDVASEMGESSLPFARGTAFRGVLGWWGSGQGCICSVGFGFVC